MALRRLPSVHYLLLRQLYLECLPLAEIARRCDRPESALLHWHDRAVEAFSQQLQADGLIPSPTKGKRKRAPRKSLRADAGQFQLFESNKPNAPDRPSESLQPQQGLERKQP